MTSRAVDPAVRFAAHTAVQPDGCWLWTGKRVKGGYGWFSLAHRRGVLAHRYAYERAYGAIPPGRDLDHRCRNRLCVRPDHLEPVTRRENLLRGRTLAAANAAKTHCPAGHPLRGENLYVWHRQRHCRACKRARDRLRPPHGRR